jgi:UDP-2,4-diacetamido-2,4,6-trideoxy-beta-L-altropyranose hydrolase
MVVIDDYCADAKVETPLIEAGFKVVVIDDLADRQHRCGVLIDPGFGRKVPDYQWLVPADATVLAGPDYALLRPEFAAARDTALTRRNAEGDHRILVSLGLTDVGGHTARAAQLLAGLAPLDVVLGSASPCLATVSALAGVTVHVDAQNMAELVAKADIAVGAGGVSVWERACLGLPSIVIILADNQAKMARALDEAGVVMALDVRDEAFDQRLVAAVERLFCDGELRDRLSRNAAHLCDGRGAERAADAILRKLA